MLFPCEISGVFGLGILLVGKMNKIFDITKLSDQELTEYIAELEEILGDPSGGSATARDLLNAEQELKRRQQHK